MRQTELHLADEDRELIESCRAKDLHHARESHQDGFRDLHSVPARTGLRDGVSNSSGAGQSQYAFPQVFRGGARNQSGKQAAATCGLPLHPEARQLAEHGGNRSWHS